MSEETILVLVQLAFHGRLVVHACCVWSPNKINFCTFFFANDYTNSISACIMPL